MGLVETYEEDERDFADEFLDEFLEAEDLDDDDNDINKAEH